MRESAVFVAGHARQGDTMNLRLPPLNCALCSAPIDPRGPFFRASGDFLPPRDPLGKFTNVPLHWPCYADWKDRPRFAQAYVHAWVSANRRNPFWWTACANERIYISVNPEPPVEEAVVRLMAVGNDIRVPLGKWRSWLAHPAAVTPDLQPIELETLRGLLPELRERFPDDHAIVHAIDPNEKSRPKRGSPKPSQVRESER